jgi:hypothetical protein
MHSEPEDRMPSEQGARGPSTRIIIAAVAIVAVIAIIYFSGGKDEPPAVDEPAPTLISAPEPIPEVKMPPAPDIPPPAPAQEPQPEEPPVEPEITLETSDQDIRINLAGVGDSPLIAQTLSAGNLVPRSVGMIDGFSRGLVPRKILPLTPPKEKFSTVKIDGKTYMDPVSYTRYDSYARAIASLNIDQLVAAFHRYRTLMEQVYEDLGYSAADMDNALIRSLDYILATPESSEPLGVKRKEAVFLYVDPELEQLNTLQKLLLRMGPENSAMIKQQARALRERLLEESG